MGSRSKRQITAAKRAREEALKERRARNQEKKHARRAEAAADGSATAPDDIEFGESVERV